MNIKLDKLESAKSAILITGVEVKEGEALDSEVQVHGSLEDIAIMICAALEIAKSLDIQDKVDKYMNEAAREIKSTNTEFVAPKGLVS